MLIGIDLGTSTCKVIAVDRDGRVVAVASRDYPMINLRPGWAEQKPDAWWRATGEAISDLTSQLPEQGQEVVGIGMCGQMHGLTPLDADGNVIRPAILWNDQRAAAGVRVDHRAGRRTRRAAAHDPQPHAARLHRRQDRLAAQPRARPLRGDGPAAEPQGLHPHADDRRVRDRRLRRVGHWPVRRRAPHLVDRAARQDRRRPGTAARRRGVDRADRQRRRRPVRGLGPAGRDAGLRRRRRRRDPDDGDGADRGGLRRLHDRDRRDRGGRVVALSRQPGRARAGQRRQRAGALAHHGRVAERGWRLPVAARCPHPLERLAEAHLRAARVAGQGHRARRRRRDVRALPARRALALRRAGRQRELRRPLADAPRRAHLPRRARGRADEPARDPRGVRRRGPADRPDHRLRRRDEGAAVAAVAGGRARARGRDGDRGLRGRRVRRGAGRRGRERGLAGPVVGARPGAGGAHVHARSGRASALRAGLRGAPAAARGARGRLRARGRGR